MSESIDYLNNPLHGLKLEDLLEQLVTHYGWEILAEYTRIQCFKNNPSMASSLKFFKKTQWAREKIERFYLYEFKNLPPAPFDEFEVPPRDRIIPSHHKPGQPKNLKLGQAPIPKDRADQKGQPKSFGNYRNQQSTAGSPDKKSQHSTNAKTKASDQAASSDNSDPYANSPR
ncbi:VF530 family protein [Colwellia sp. MEBiC06753]